MDFDKTGWSCRWNSDETVHKSLPGMKGSSSAIHKAGDFTVHGRSTGLPGIIPVEQESVHWLSMGAASRNDLLRSFCTAAGHMAAL